MAKGPLFISKVTLITLETTVTGIINAPRGRKQMIDVTQDIDDISPRRRFFRRFGGAIALGLAGLASKPLYAQTQAADLDGPNWPGALQGRHRQVVDAYEANAGFPLA